MAEIDSKYEAMTENKGLQVIETSKFKTFIHALKKLFTANANEYEKIDNK